MPKQDRILRDGEVEAKTGLSRTTRWRRERDGTFPKRRQIGPNAVGWLESDIDSWLADLPEVDGKRGAA